MTDQEKTKEEGGGKERKNKEKGKRRAGRTETEKGEEKVSLVSALEGNNLLIQRELLY